MRPSISRVGMRRFPGLAAITNSTAPSTSSMLISTKGMACCIRNCLVRRQSGHQGEVYIRTVPLTILIYKGGHCSPGLDCPTLNELLKNLCRLPSAEPGRGMRLAQGGLRAERRKNHNWATDRQHSALPSFLLGY